MFEKEAEDYAKKWILDEDDIRLVFESFKDGAEFGYNKKCEETFEMALSQIKHDRAVVIEENERLHAKITDLEECAKELTEAKEIIRELLLSDTRNGSDWTGYLIDLKERAEQFLEEIKENE